MADAPRHSPAPGGRKAAPAARTAAPLTRATLEEAVFASFLGDIDALKPGNVSRHADGHGMTYADFRRSAEVVTPILCRADLSMGERLLRAVERTVEAVGCNTNLGMLLLFLPVLKVAEQGEPGRRESGGGRKGGSAPLSAALRRVVAAVRGEETAAFFAAIALANPGGLGRAARHDVRASPPPTLLEAMRAARRRDLIARQYINGYRQVLDFGLPRFEERLRRGNNPQNGAGNRVEWATVGCYLSYLARFRDSHIARKFGPATAERVRAGAVSVSRAYDRCASPSQAMALLSAYDRELKAAQINPGTSADLTAATALFYRLHRVLAVDRGAEERRRPADSG